MITNEWHAQASIIITITITIIKDKADLCNNNTTFIQSGNSVKDWIKQARGRSDI